MSAEAVTTGAAQPAARRTFAASLDRRDVLNVALLLGVFVLVLLIVPPVRDFPMIDDWIYKQQVDKLLALQYTPHPWTQASALSHVAWGALFALLLGVSYTALSVANLVASTLTLVVFYALLRALDVTPSLALFGSILLFVQPMFLHLSTTFMTDITFLGMVMLSCYLLVRWAQTGRDGFLWAASVSITAAALNRQLGVSLVIIPLVYMWTTGRLTPRRIFSVAVIPVLTILAYYMWERGQPPSLLSSVIQADLKELIEQPLQWAGARASVAILALLVSGLFLTPLLKPIRRSVLFVGVLSVFILVLAQTYLTIGYFVPYTGSIVDQNGFVDCCEDLHSAVWGNATWGLLLLIASVNVAFLVCRVVKRMNLAWLRQSKPLPDRRAAIVYGSAAMLTFAALLVPSTFFDRYYLPLVAALIVFACREASTVAVTRFESVLRWSLLALVLLFSIAAQHDNMKFREIRWEASQELVRQGVPRDKIGMSYEWGGEYLFARQADLISQSGNFAVLWLVPFYRLDPEYYVTEDPKPGYDVLWTENYRSWLEFSKIHTVLVQKRR
jgi:hypothetical protein